MEMRKKYKEWKPCKGVKCSQSNFCYGELRKENKQNVEIISMRKSVWNEKQKRISNKSYKENQGDGADSIHLNNYRAWTDEEFCLMHKLKQREIIKKGHSIN